MIYPPNFTYPEKKGDVAQIVAVILSHLVSDHRAVVQAGGCSGLWPLALANYFDRVYTFEPEPTNFQCVLQNVASRSNVSAYGFAVGDRSARVKLTRPRDQAGLWRVDGEGEIPMVTIDDVVGDRPVDAIVLDVEGYEVPALRGAAHVIETHHPVLWFEFMFDPDGIRALLEAHGYGPPLPGIGGDHYSFHRSHVH